MDQCRTLKRVWQQQQITFGFLMAVFIFIAGCTIGGMSSVNRTIESSTDSFDTAFVNAVWAMNDVGKVTNSDKEMGYVNGTSTSGVDLVVTLERLPVGGVKLNTKATLPAGKIGYGIGMVSAAADKFVAAYEKY